jgi:hypothetical protein
LNLQPRGFEGDVSPSWGVCEGAGPLRRSRQGKLQCRPGDGWMVQFLSPAPQQPSVDPAALYCFIVLMPPNMLLQPFLLFWILPRSETRTMPGGNRMSSLSCSSEHEVDAGRCVDGSSLVSRYACGKIVRSRRMLTAKRNTGPGACPTLPS